MKDMYSFHTSVEDFESFYEKAKQGYLKAYSRMGLDAKVTESSGGSFSKKASHEFQVETPAGEDDLILCRNCSFAQNTEIATLKAGDKCPNCKGELVATKGIEVGNIFDLSDRFSKDFNFVVQGEDGKSLPILMGCYGIGVSRLVGAIVEASHDDKGIIWPKAVAPFAVNLVTLNAKSAEVQKSVDEAAEKLYVELSGKGVEVLWDDREGVAPGAKFADADLIGIPVRVVVSEKSLAAGGAEWKMRSGGESEVVSLDTVISSL
jgi:prolyl-tRNA synthetase